MSLEHVESLRAQLNRDRPQQGRRRDWLSPRGDEFRRLALPDKVTISLVFGGAVSS